MKIFKIMSLHNFQAEYEIRINIPVCFCFLLHAVMCWRSVWSRKLLHNELRSWIKLHTFFEALKKVDRKGPYLMKLWSKNSPHVLLNIRNENPLYKPSWIWKSLHVLTIKMRPSEEVSYIVFVQRITHILKNVERRGGFQSLFPAGRIQDGKKIKLRMCWKFVFAKYTPLHQFRN